MNGYDDFDWEEWERAFVEQATRIVRLLAWTAMLVLCCAVLWILAINASWADPGSVSGTGDPRAAAAELGRAGQAAAGADPDREGSVGRIAEIVVAGREGRINVLSPKPEIHDPGDAESPGTEDGGDGGG